MLNSLNKKYPFNDNLKVNTRSIAAVSLGIFLFLLFFQPFQVQNPDFNNRLIILATFGAITLVLLSIFRLVIPSIFITAFSEERWTILKEILIDLLFVICNSVAFAFFARYVGRIPMTFPIVINIVIISITAAAVVVVTNQFYLLKKKVQKLEIPLEETNAKETIEIPEEIEFESENKSEYFTLFLEQLILIRSANNYIEIIYKQNDEIKKKLIRSTMKSTENLLKKYAEIVRCHRSCMVNKNYIKKVSRGTDGLTLNLFDYPQEIPVSRQYVLRLKESLKTA
ncbi:LytTR family transcriptional regulator DNA-binding domain-containing protein [Draconibacterium sp. IB214405]|uniref:LytTR family DNA-binding domain-containing protein n=1 Tax=Draconibacterium sp. IB214405 TaxID=3097352 RepID=UPI002A0ABB84|nr:LytTR family transcriptional regulator DNA-binding domain-containing protein [Draconibacterium sp. IB214405]MDX8337644.1 LytTR family transcriptional regulator DNA-binding domain-containing protein [Draconibacterium sp. IB214405]